MGVRGGSVCWTVFSVCWWSRYRACAISSLSKVFMKMLLLCENDGIMNKLLVFVNGGRRRTFRAFCSKQFVFVAVLIDLIGVFCKSVVQKCVCLLGMHRIFATEKFRSKNGPKKMHFCFRVIFFYFLL